MIRSFKTKKANQVHPALQTFEAWIDNGAKNFAAYLSDKTAQVQPRKMATLIMAGCFLFSICVGFVAFKTTRYKTEIHVYPIRAPLLRIHQPDSMNELVLLRISHFHHQLDSLKQNNFLRYDSFLKSRPGLLDSILTVEQFFNK